MSLEQLNREQSPDTLNDTAQPNKENLDGDIPEQPLENSDADINNAKLKVNSSASLRRDEDTDIGDE